MSLVITKVHEEKSCCVTPNVASNFFEPTTQTTLQTTYCVVCHGLKKSHMFVFKSLQEEKSQNKDEMQQADI